MTFTKSLVAPGLRVALSAALGRCTAKQELKWMLSSVQHIPSASQSSTLSAMIQRRLDGEPLQYILVLIPRQETEDWSLRLSKLITPTSDQTIRLLDLCTGSGCIPLLLCRLWTSGAVKALAVDIAEEAVQLARDNANHVDVRVQDIDDRRLGRTRNTISIMKADILEQNFPLDLKTLGWTPFDVLTANPPYIPKAQFDALPRSVRHYEDSRALLGDPVGSSGGDGLTFYRTIAHLCASGLVKNGALIALEVGEGQSRQVEHLMIAEGKVKKTEIWRDPWDKERVVFARK